MPTYVLDGTGRAHLPRRPIMVMTSVEGQFGSAQVQAVSAVEGSIGVHPNPELTIVPRVDSPVVLRIVPANGLHEFPAGTVVHVVLQVDGPAGQEPERAALRPLDVSGQSTLNIATLTPEGNGIVVSATRTGPEEQLGELAHQARVQARTLLGVDRVPEQFQVNMVVAVDASASMRSSVACGDVEAVLEVLTGLSTVIAPDLDLRVCSVGSGVSWAPATEIANTARGAVEFLDAQPAVVGFRSAATALAGIYPSGNTVTYLVTDGVPADVAALTAVDEIDGEARHLVTLVDPTVSQLRTSRAAVPVTPVAPSRAGASVSARLLGEPGALTSVVRSLLRGCFAPGTELGERTA